MALTNWQDRIISLEDSVSHVTYSAYVSTAISSSPSGTVVSIPNGGTYLPDSGDLLVSANGFLLVKGVDYSETSETSVTIYNLPEDRETTIQFIIFQSGSTYDFSYVELVSATPAGTVIDIPGGLTVHPRKLNLFVFYSGAILTYGQDYVLENQRSIRVLTDLERDRTLSFIVLRSAPENITSKNFVTMEQLNGILEKRSRTMDKEPVVHYDRSDKHEWEQKLIEMLPFDKELKFDKHGLYKWRVPEGVTIARIEAEGAGSARPFDKVGHIECYVRLTPLAEYDIYIGEAGTPEVYGEATNFGSDIYLVPPTDKGVRCHIGSRVFNPSIFTVDKGPFDGSIYIRY